MEENDVVGWFDRLDAKTKGLLAGAAVMFAGAVVMILGATGSLPGGGGGPSPTTAPPSTETVPPPTSGPSTDPRLDLDNPAGLQLTSGKLTQEALDEVGFTEADPFTAPISPQSNGGNPQGQFRLQCLPSHFSTEDPVVFPGEPGAGHLHMFFGNLEADAFSTPESLLASGASTCQGGELNRSAYWMPAMVDSDGSVITPEAITLYYKSHRPAEVDGVYPHGLRMLAGMGADGEVRSTFRAGERLSWGCYNPSLGISTGLRNTIPGTVSAPCPNGQAIQATIQFPQCIALDDNGEPAITSDNLVDHTAMLFNEAGNYGDQNKPCPSSHPYRVPQISYLVRWPTVDQEGRALDVTGWKLSSDDMHNAAPGGSLHADWLGAWNLRANQVWLDGCFNPDAPQNCSLGQTAGPRGFARIVGESVVNMIYVGPTRLEVE